MFTKEAIKNFIPHRDPFLFLDSIDNIDIPNMTDVGDISLTDLTGSSVTAFFDVKDDHSIFKGHFPGNPIWPGVVQVEMMAQASCFILKCIQDNYGDRELEVALMGIKEVKFRKPVIPNSKLKIVSTCERIRGAIASFSSKIYQDDLLVSEGAFMATFAFKKLRPTGVDEGIM